MSAVAPTITSRTQWHANPLVTPADYIATPTRELWLHHTAGEQFDDAGMRMLQAFTLHRNDEHYVDLEYAFILDHVDCRIFESRGPHHNSAATGFHNTISQAICVMGNFQVDDPSDKLILTLANLVAWGYEQGWWPLGFTGGHRDASGNKTACPGDKLEAKITQINFLAMLIHTKGLTTVPTGHIAPEYNPPIQLHPTVADLECPSGGAWTLHTDGGVGSWGGAPSWGSMAGDPDFVGRTPARLELPDVDEKHAGKKLIVVATSTERYALPR